MQKYCNIVKNKLNMLICNMEKNAFAFVVDPKLDFIRKSELSFSKTMKFISYYWLIERQPLAVRPLEELFAQEGCLGLIASERFDTKLVRSEAVKLFKLN